MNNPTPSDVYVPSTSAQQTFTLQAGQLDNQVILITGATGGLGTQLSLACAAAGATIVLAGRSLKKLEKLYDLLEDSGAATPAIVPLQQDTAGPAEYIAIADKLTEEFGCLDALVHTSADLGTATPQMAIEHAEWIRVMNVNLTSARLLTLYCMPLLQSSSLGSLLFLLDRKTTAYWGTYGISKQALQGFMSMLADESENVRASDGQVATAINGYDPGPMRTRLRRRAFPGELESETEPPETRLGPLLYLLSRADRTLHNTAVRY